MNTTKHESRADGPDPHMMALVRAGLGSRDYEVREHAIGVLEDWRGERSRMILVHHRDPDPHLAGYAKQVADEIAAELEAER